MNDGEQNGTVGVASGGRKAPLAVIVVLTVALALVSAALVLALQPRGTTTTPPEPVVLRAPEDVLAAAGDGTMTVTWADVENAESYDLYFASEPGVTKDNYDTLPDGARRVDVASPYTIDELSNGKTYYVRVVALAGEAVSDDSAESSATPTATAVPPPPVTTYVSALAEFDTGGPVVGAQVTVRSEDGSVVETGSTGPDGRLNIGMRPVFPTRILVEVHLQRAGEPSVTGFRWSAELDSGGSVDVGRLVLPDPANKRLERVGGDLVSSDGRVVVPSVPPEVDAVFAKPYEADVFPDAFPGDLAEGRTQPINNLVVLWISALDASGAQVFDLSSPATVRVAVPPTQWVDLEDLQPGNGVIDTPIYSFDYDTAYWVREPNGLLTDAAGAVLDEGLEMAVRTGAYTGEVYAEFAATHFSWWNVDKPPKDCRNGGLTTDFGDAPDPKYPSLLASDGARHLTICRAWLGAWADGEPDAETPDLDFYDDGVLSASPLSFRVTNWNFPASLYLNVLIDRNSDGDWEDGDEWAVQNLGIVVPTGKGQLVETDAEWDAESYLRVTLTGEEIPAYTGRGEFEIGETEDYPFLTFRLSVSVSGNGTVSSDPAGIDCRKDAGTCGAMYQAGTSVTLTADPDSGESFIGWSGACDGANATCTVTMDKDLFVHAAFTQPYYTLWVAVVGFNQTTNETVGRVTSDPVGIDCSGFWDSGGGSAEGCKAEFPRDTNVTLTATPEPGWKFAYWSGQDPSGRGTCQGSDPVCYVIMDIDRYVVAYFEKE